MPNDFTHGNIRFSYNNDLSGNVVVHDTSRGDAAVLAVPYTALQAFADYLIAESQATTPTALLNELLNRCQDYTFDRPEANFDAVLEVRGVLAALHCDFECRVQRAINKAHQEQASIPPLVPDAR